MLQNFKYILDEHPFRVKSNIEALSNIRSLNLNADTFTFNKYDVESLYPSTDIEQGIGILRMYIIHLKQYTQEQIQIISLLLRLLVDSRYFQYEDKYYQQCYGVPIGGTLSGFLAELVLQDTELKIVSKPIPGLTTYLRYVDDLLIVWDKNNGIYQLGLNRSSQNEEEEGDKWPVTTTKVKLPDTPPNNPAELMNLITTLRPEIKLVEEASNTQSISFLDLSLKLTSLGLDTQIYRKTTYAWDLPLWQSRCTRVHMRSAIFPLILRAHRILDEPNTLATEIKLIFGHCLNKGYPIRWLQQLNREAKSIVTKNPADRPVKPIYRRICHFTGSQDFSKLFRHYNIQLVNKKEHTLFQKIRNDKDSRAKYQTPGIYCVPLREPAGIVKAYIGRTLRTVDERLKEHQYNVRAGDPATALANAVLNEGMQPLWDETTVLTRPRTLFRSILSEYLEIMTSRLPLVNTMATSPILDKWTHAVI